MVRIYRPKWSIASLNLIKFVNFTDMHFSLEKPEALIIAKIAEAASSLGVEAFVVGGIVRDKLLGRPCKDIDVVCLGDAIALANSVSALFVPEPKVSWFKNFGTAHFNVKGYDVEFVGARKESYQQESRNPIVEQGSLQDDQERRDFTINALAFSVMDVLPTEKEQSFNLTSSNSAKLHDALSIIDPFNGIEDLEKGIIKTPLAPEKTFSDDPLRMLRAIRFASQLGFTIETNTLLGISDTAHRISIISQERVTDEFNKIMLSKKPSVGLDLLYKTGLLKIIFPQMVDLAGAE